MDVIAGAGVSKHRGECAWCEEDRVERYLVWLWGMREKTGTRTIPKFL